MIDKSSLLSNSIKPLSVNELDVVLSWRNSDSVRKFMFNTQKINKEEHIKWFERSKNDLSRHLLVFELESKVKGFAQFSVTKGGIAEWGFYVDPEAERGTGTLLAVNVLQYAFTKLNLHKVCARVILFNDRSLALHKKMNFIAEGHLRDDFFDGENYHDVICFGLLKSDWLIKG